MSWCSIASVERCLQHVAADIVEPLVKSTTESVISTLDYSLARGSFV